MHPMERRRGEMKIGKRAIERDRELRMESTSKLKIQWENKLVRGEIQKSTIRIKTDKIMRIYILVSAHCSAMLDTWRILFILESRGADLSKLGSSSGKIMEKMYIFKRFFQKVDVAYSIEVSGDIWKAVIFIMHCAWQGESIYSRKWTAVILYMRWGKQQ